MGKNFNYNVLLRTAVMIKILFKREKRKSHYLVILRKL